LLEFLFLPGFTMKEGVTQLSGRGVGLDVVQEMIRQVRGLVRITAKPGEGTRFKLELPLTLSVVRSLLVASGASPMPSPSPISRGR
jgi:two-component system sensor histidine kinase and response regulator WspE